MMQFSVRLLLEATFVVGALLATVFAWGAIGFVVVALLLAAIFASRRKWGVSIVFVFWASGLFAFASRLEPVQVTREVPFRRKCPSNLHQLATAIFAYHEARREFPPAYTVDEQGNRIHSWRTLVLREPESRGIYNKIRLNEPWNSPYNSQFHSVRSPIFECPDRFEFGRRPCTHYVAVIGPNTVWPRTGSRSFDDIEDPANTIMLVEVENSDIHWMEPRDLQFDKIVMQVNPEDGPGISGRHLSGEKRGLVRSDIWLGGANVVFADGHTEFLPIDTPPDKLRAMLMVKKKTD